MPKYPWLAKKEIDIQSTPAKIHAMKTLGVPYPDNYEQQAIADTESSGRQHCQRPEDEWN